jgi:myo-inositol-1(or 4)-monophosphatase
MHQTVLDEALSALSTIAPALTITTVSTVNTDAIAHDLRPIIGYAADHMLKPSLRPSDVTRKPDNTPVTKVDVAINTFLTNALTSLLPGSAVLGEEGSTGPIGEVPTWVIDPIDGTYSFIAGLGLATVAVSLVLPGAPVPVIAAVADPWTQSYYLYSDSGPTMRGSTLVHAATTTKIKDAYIAICASKLYEPLSRFGAHVVTSLPAVRMGACVCDGGADALVFQGSPWDVATTLGLVTGAGGFIAYRTPPSPLAPYSELVAAGTQELAEAILDIWDLVAPRPR